MHRKLLPLLLLSAVASGCAWSGHHCLDESGCGSCAHISHLPNRLACGTGCGEIYWDEWLSDPPACEDPCDDCGNYVGPRGKSFSPLAWCNFWGLRSCGDCGTCDACTATPDCGSDCGGCSDCSSPTAVGHIPPERAPVAAAPRPIRLQSHAEPVPGASVATRQAAQRYSKPIKTSNSDKTAARPTEKKSFEQAASHRLRRGRSLIALTSAKFSGRHDKSDRDSTAGDE